MRKYRFDLLHHDIPGFVEKDHIIEAQSLEDALLKFSRKHELDAPPYWDEPSFDKMIEITFKRAGHGARYRITWL